ncbi:UvrD-helicase domain-containing protein, partial [Photobacterium swingsii]
MIEYTIDEKLRAEEIQVQSNISSLIDNGMSFYFLAGAGAGKTYALVESLKYYLNKKQNELEKTGRKLACITYTNAAKGEVIERLYENDNITVSTIHSFLWGIIEHHQRELLDIHIEYLREVISDTESSLYTDDKN